MIEKPELTLQILEYFADEDVTWPADKLVEDLEAAFPGEGEDSLVYHVICAHEAGFLHANISETATSDGVISQIGYISGLTQAGGEYVRHSRTKLLDQATDLAKTSGVEITTKLLAKVLPKLAIKALDLG